jgi:hypothetical protein
MKRLIAMLIALAFSAASVRKRLRRPRPDDARGVAAEEGGRPQGQAGDGERHDRGRDVAVVDHAHPQPAPPSKKTDKATPSSAVRDARCEQPGDEPVRTGRRHRGDQGRQERPKAAKPDMTDPTIQKAMQNQKGN